MKVLFVANDSAIFDKGSAVRARMRLYAEAIGTLHIISRTRSGARFEQDGALTLHPVTMPRVLMFLFLPLTVRALIKREGIDVVSAQDPFEYGWLAMRAVRGTNTKLHIQVHTDFLSPWFVKSKGFRAPKSSVPFGNSVRLMLADKVLPQAQGVRVVSERIAKSLIARYGSRIPTPTIIPIAVANVAPTAVPLPPHTFTFSLIAVSRLSPEKRIQDILYAIARIQQVYPSVGLFIVGEGSERLRLEILAKRLGLQKKVLFLGARKDAWGLMKSAHALIQASAYEGYGLTLVEAALARIPIITTDVGIVGEVFNGYEDILSVPVADPAALAVHITGLVEDHQARLSLALNALTKAQTHLAKYSNQPALIAQDLSEMLARA